MRPGSERSKAHILDLPSPTVSKQGLSAKRRITAVLFRFLKTPDSTSSQNRTSHLHSRSHNTPASVSGKPHHRLHSPLSRIEASNNGRSYWTRKDSRSVMLPPFAFSSRIAKHPIDIAWHRYMGWWGNIGSLPQKGVTTYALSSNRQRPLAGTAHAAVFNSWRRFKGSVLYVIPPFVAYYFIMDWAEKRFVFFFPSSEGGWEYTEEGREHG